MVSFNYSNDASIAFARNASDMLGKSYWYLCNPLDVEITMSDKKYSISIPEGFLTDGASVPRIFWSICPKWDNSHHAVILHDYLCEYGIAHVDGVATVIDRSHANYLFLQALKFDGLSKIKCSMMYAAVRLYANINGITSPKLNELKLKFEDEIRLNLKKEYYK